MNKQLQTSNGMIDKLRRVLTNLAQGGLFAAFVPLENFKGTRLESLYTGDLSAFVNSIVIIMIIVGGTAAALRLAYSGAMNFGKDFWQNRTNLKEMRVEIAIGLFILLSVWIVLNQINPNMLNLEFLFPKVPEAAAPAAGTTIAPAKYGVSPTEQKAADAIFKDEQSVRDQMKAGGIAINKNPCTAVRERNCTNVGGIGGNAIGGLKSLKANCRCDVLVNGGTEFWNHTENTTHQPGNSVVDIAPNPTLNQYLLGAGVAPTNGVKVTKGGAVYTYETLGANSASTGNHWHVKY